MKPIFDDFLGLASNGSVNAILKTAGAEGLSKVLEQRRAGKVGRQDYVAALVAARDQLAEHAEQLFQERVSPLVFYIGSTGLLPDEIEAKAQSAEATQAKHPALAFSKDEAEGTYYEVGDTIIGIYASTEYFSR
jgi:hypothetical protein